MSDPITIPTQLKALVDFARKVLQLVPDEPTDDMGKAIMWTASVCGLTDARNRVLPQYDHAIRSLPEQVDTVPDNQANDLAALRGFAWDVCEAAFAIDNTTDTPVSDHVPVQLLVSLLQERGLHNDKGIPTAVLTGDWRDG